MFRNLPQRMKLILPDDNTHVVVLEHSSSRINDKVEADHVEQHSLCHLIISSPKWRWSMYGHRHVTCCATCTCFCSVSVDFKVHRNIGSVFHLSKCNSNIYCFLLS